MKINENIKIIGQKVILIPYEEKHVEKYHEWMKDSDLQNLTASKPLTLEEEYEMQKTWRSDEDKCTFLIMSKDCYDTTQDELQALIGDTNLFIEITDDNKKIGEAEIMIAEKSVRRQGFGYEAMLLMLKFGYDHLKIDKFISKIGEENLKSINMFKKMQFQEISRSQVFKEVTLERLTTTEWKSSIEKQIAFKIENYI